MTRTWSALFAFTILAMIAFVIHLIAGRTAAGTEGRDPNETAVADRRRGIKALIIGTDGRASTSKMQALLWTGALLYALVFLLVWGRSTCDEETSENPICAAAIEGREAFKKVIAQELQIEYYVLLGFPLTAALAAKAMTSAKTDDGTLTKPKLKEGQRGVLSGVAEVVSNDAGQTDLIDFQYFAFNLLALGFFFLEFLTQPGDGLPTLPRTLVALAGLSAATYTTKKGLETSQSLGNGDGSEHDDNKPKAKASGRRSR